MGVNREVFKRGDKQAVRAELGLEQDAFTYLFVGNVIKQKGIEELLLAFQQVQEEANRKVKLVIIGSRRDKTLLKVFSHLLIKMCNLLIHRSKTNL